MVGNGIMKCCIRLEGAECHEVSVLNAVSR